MKIPIPTAPTGGTGDTTDKGLPAAELQKDEMKMDPHLKDQIGPQLQKKVLVIGLSDIILYLAILILKYLLLPVCRDGSCLADARTLLMQHSTFVAKYPFLMATGGSQTGLEHSPLTLGS